MLAVSLYFQAIVVVDIYCRVVDDAFVVLQVPISTSAHVHLFAAAGFLAVELSDECRGGFDLSVGLTGSPISMFFCYVIICQLL